MDPRLVIVGVFGKVGKLEKSVKKGTYQLNLGCDILPVSISALLIMGGVHAQTQQYSCNGAIYSYPHPSCTYNNNNNFNNNNQV